MDFPCEWGLLALLKWHSLDVSLWWVLGTVSASQLALTPSPNLNQVFIAFMGKGMSGNQRLGQAPAPFFQTPSAFSPHRPQDNLWWALLCPLYRCGHQDLAFIETTWDISISRLSDFKSHFPPRPESLYHSCLWSLQLLLSKISPHFLQTDSPRGESADSHTHTAASTHLVPWMAHSPSLGKLAVVLWKCPESATCPPSWISHSGSVPGCWL